MDNIKNALEFYLDNDLNEVISEKPQNHFLVGNKKKKEKKVEIKIEKKIEIKTEIRTEFKSENKQTVSTVKQIFSTSEALSTLAKKSAQNNEAQNSSTEKFTPINDIIAKAKKIAAAAKNLAELKKAVENFDGCGLKKMATNTVFCDGNPDSRIMVIGEAPGNHEDLQGIPFCGDSGKLLDDMFKSINLDRTKLYISNVIFWRPPGNRRPTDEELAICRPFVERHIQLVDPKVLILVGSTSMSAILGMNDPVTGVRGKFIDYAPDFLAKKTKAFVVFHPSYLMRQSGKKRTAWRDMLALERFLKN